ncbi:uncharacterized protein LOC134234556 isoform X2 [Saccostrea cucullata]|uniref:uncharacterized protein LOC134234556 isoform X2 n=1 Tax=Saccostrea cuccullata TaxID=36930 RepID=UPI002ED409C5
MTGKREMVGLLILSPLFHLSVMSRERCLGSLSTMKYTSSCPKNEAEWRSRATEFGCQNVLQNCTSKEKFKYHCVLNVWGNATTEMCAEEIIIVGRKCAEFSHGGGFLQEHYEHDCNECPYHLNSSQSFLYQECFKFNNLIKDTNATAVSKKFNGSTSPDSSFVQVAVCVIVVIVLVSAVILSIIFWRKKKFHCPKKFFTSVSRDTKKNILKIRESPKKLMIQTRELINEVIPSHKRDLMKDFKDLPLA